MSSRLARAASPLCTTGFLRGLRTVGRSWSALVGLIFALLTSVSAYAVSPNIVVSQVYGGGGNTGAVYRNDFVELFNRSTSAVSVAGWTIQYASAAGTAWSTTALNGSIPAGGYYLIQLAAGTGGTTSLPTPDATGTLALSATAGKLALVNNTTALTGTCPLPNAAIVDFVGFGTTASCFEGSATAAPSNTNAVLRAANGCTDTDANNTDFAVGVPNPRNSAAAANSCSSLPTLSVNSVTLAEGNSGTTSFVFTVGLSAPAGAGGVTFDIATQNGTATAPGDFTAQTLTAQTIAAGSSAYTFTVQVNGDTLPETDESFSVAVTNATGATIATGTGTGTITNDDAAPNLTIAGVSQNEGDSGTTPFVFTVSLSAPAPAGGVTFDIATANGTALAGSDYVTSSLTGQTIPAGSSTYSFTVSVNGDTVGEANETFSVNVTNVVGAIGLTTTAQGTIVNDDVYRIHTIQGSGAASPFAAQLVTIEGIVSADFQGPNQLKGFYIQEPDARADADPATSEGMFIYTNLVPYTVAVGDLVRVTGTVTEFGTAPNTLTEIVTPTISTVSTGNALPAAVNVSLPIATAGELERYEGMRVTFTQTLTVSDHFDLAHFGEVTLSANGRSLQPTNQVDPNDDPASGTTSSGNGNAANVTAFADLNVRSRILLDDASTLTYPPAIPFADPATNTLRLGSTVANLTGILSQSFGAHRVYATTPPAFAYAPRPASPPVVGGNLKVASMNVLNYFNGDGLGGGFPTSRGADTLNEFNRQRAKVIAAVLGLNADVVGLLEMENDGNGATSAIQDLINGLNVSAGAGAWAFVADPAGWGTFPGSTDQIRPAFIYKTAAVAPAGAATSPNSSAFVNARAPIAQTFKLLSNNEQFAAVINHFKAKGGSGTGLDADLGDGQGQFNNSRKLQAAALIAFINTLTPTTPRVIAMGDFNAYEQEDPMDVLRAGGLSTIINNSYSYMFDGQSGSLDHALGTPALMLVVSGSGKWHINADEPVYLDYNVETKNAVGCTSSCTTPDYFAASPFRASDHDPVLVGLQLGSAVSTQTITFPAIAPFSWGGGSAVLAATASSGLPVTYSVASGPCVITGTTVTASAALLCTINADQAGNASFSAAPRVQQTVIVTGATQTITFAALAGKVFGDAPFVVTATSTSSLPVRLSSTAMNVCTTSGNTVTIIAAGICTIAADQDGNGDYAVAPQVVRSFTVGQGTQTIAFAPLPDRTFRSAAFNLTASSSSGLAVVFSSLTPTVCTVNAGSPLAPTGTTVVPLVAGTCTITANQAGDANVAAAPQVVQSFAILIEPQTISFPPISSQLVSALPFAVPVNSSVFLLPVVTSLTPAVCSVVLRPPPVIGPVLPGTFFVITLTGNAGICSLRATQAGLPNQIAAALPVEQSFAVTALATQTISFPPIATQLVTAPSFTASASASSGLEVVITTLTPSICTAFLVPLGAPIPSTIVSISLTGVIGTCTIRAAQPGNANVTAAVPVEQSFAVVNAVSGTSIGLQSTQNPALAGARISLAATVSGKNPTGTVIFRDYGVLGSNAAPTIVCIVPLANNRATCDLPPNSRSEQRLFSATYGGDVNNAASEASLTQAYKGINLGVLPQLAALGAPVRLVATLPAGATGSVAFARDGSPIPGCNTIAIVSGATLNTATCVTSATASFSRYTAAIAGNTAEANGNAFAAVARDRTNHWWLGDAENGWGLVINQHGETPFVTLYIYDAEGKPDWLVMSGVWNSDKTIFTGDFYRPTSASFSAYNPASFVAGAVAGRGSFTFNADDTGNFAYVIDGIAGSKTIRKLEFSGAAGGPGVALSDIWWNPAENGWGVSITNQNNAIFAVWFTYGADGKVTWYPMPGGTWSGNTYTGTIYRTNSGAWLGVPYDASKFKATAVGTMSFRFVDANTADMTYTVDGVTQTKTITRQPY